MKPVFIITGGKSSGKTTFLLDLSKMLQQKGYEVGGFVARHDLITDSYTLRNLQTNQEVLLMQRTASFHQSPYYFELFPDGVEAGRNWINAILQKPSQLVVIDEVGRYELAGELWYEGFSNLINSSIPVLFTTPTKHLKVIVEKWNIEPAAIFHPPDFINTEKVFAQIDSLLL